MPANNNIQQTKSFSHVTCDAGKKSLLNTIGTKTNEKLNFQIFTFSTRKFDIHDCFNFFNFEKKLNNNVISRRKNNEKF